MPIHEIEVKYKNSKPKRKFYFSLYYTDLLGERKKYKSKKFDKKEDAKKSEAIFLLKNKEETTSHSDITFNIIFDEYLLLHAKKVRKQTLEKTINVYKYIKPYLGEIRIVKLTFTKYQQWHNYISECKLGTNYKNKIYRLIKTLLTYSNNFYGITNTIPMRLGGFQDPNQFKKELHFFTSEEFSSFISAIDDNVFKAFFTTLYYMGIRQGEATALTWKDIDFNKNILKVNKTLTTKIKVNHLQFHHLKLEVLIEN